MEAQSKLSKGIPGNKVATVNGETKVGEVIPNKNTAKNTIKAAKAPPKFAKYKIYILKRIYVAGYDEYEGKVIVASSAKAARKIADLKTGDEGKIWSDPHQVLCREISLENPAVILTSFNGG